MVFLVTATALQSLRVTRASLHATYSGALAAAETLAETLRLQLLQRAAEAGQVVPRVSLHRVDADVTELLVARPGDDGWLARAEPTVALVVGVAAVELDAAPAVVPPAAAAPAAVPHAPTASAEAVVPPAPTASAEATAMVTLPRAQRQMNLVFAELLGMAAAARSEHAEDAECGLEEAYESEFEQDDADPTTHSLSLEEADSDDYPSSEDSVDRADRPARYRFSFARDSVRANAE